MLRILFCPLVLMACATSSRTATRDVHDCVYLGLMDPGRRAEVLSETETMGPTRIVWMHPPEAVRGYLVESNRYVYSCPTPRPPPASLSSR